MRVEIPRQSCHLVPIFFEEINSRAAIQTANLEKMVMDGSGRVFQIGLSQRKVKLSLEAKKHVVNLLQKNSQASPHE